MPTYLDILNRLPGITPGKGTPYTSAGVGSDAAPAVIHSPTPAGAGNAVVERFRSVTAQMQSTANASIQQEIERIVNVPIMEDLTEEEIDLVSWWYCPSGEFRLFQEQAKAMVAFWKYGSLFGPIATGRGKTWISVMVANDAYTRFGVDKILILNKGHLIKQLRTVELPKYRNYTSINVPFYWLTEETAVKRLQRATSGLKGCYVLSYDLLSSKTGAEIMLAIEPKLIIGDEIHAILGDSARSRRFWETVKIFSPKIVPLSGTLTKKSSKEYHRLAAHTLQERCWLPRSKSLNDDWAELYDSNAANIDQYTAQNYGAPKPQTGDVSKLVHWGNKNFSLKLPNDLVGFRGALKQRMQTTPGVVTSKAILEGSTLRISNVTITKAEKEATPGWERLEKLVKDLVTLMVAPNGDELEYPMHVWRYRYELEGIGGYNDLSWPTVEKIADRRKITTAEADDLLYLSKQHHKLHQEYSRELRIWLGNRARTGMDTPMLVGHDMYVNGAKNVGTVLYEAWSVMRAAWFKEIIERDKTFVRVCPFRINRIIQWAKEHYADNPNRGAVIWYDNQGVGLWLKEAFQEAGLPMIHCPAGKTGRDNLMDSSRKDRFALATYNAFSDGLNIQYHYSHSFSAQWAREAGKMEQLISRLHRTGQPEDEVRIFRSHCSEFDDVLLAACLNDSAYIHQTMGPQKLMYADWDELPKLMPYAVMKEWGCEPTEGTTESRKLLTEKFMEKDE